MFPSKNHQQAPTSVLAEMRPWQAVTRPFGAPAAASRRLLRRPSPAAFRFALGPSDACRVSGQFDLPTGGHLAGRYLAASSLCSVTSSQRPPSVLTGATSPHMPTDLAQPFTALSSRFGAPSVAAEPQCHAPRIWP